MTPAGDPVMAQLERLAESGIALLPAEIGAYFLCAREPFGALVERTAAGFGAIGSTGLLTEEGLAPLVWRGSDPWFVRKQWQRPATSEEVTALRQFSESLQNALQPPPTPPR